MPKVADLIVDMASVLRIDPKTVATYARHLREAGMLSQGGRGRGGADATELDAARLLIAIMVDGYAKEAPQILKDFGRLKCGGEFLAIDENGVLHHPDLRMSELLDMPQNPELEDVIAALIGAYGGANTEAEKILRANMWGAVETYPMCRLIIPSGTPTAEIQIAGHRYFFHSNSQAKAPGSSRASGGISPYDQRLEDESRAEFQRLHKRYFRVIRTERSICQAEFTQIGEMLTGRRQPGEILSDEEWGARMTAALTGSATFEGD